MTSKPADYPDIPLQEAGIKKGKCVCSWPQCRKWQKIFALHHKQHPGEEQLRGASCRTLRFSNNAKSSLFNKWVRKHLGWTGSANFAIGEDIRVAPHHWWPEQNRRFNSGMHPSTTVSIDVIREISNVVDEQAYWTNPSTNQKEYFMAPTVPCDSVKKDIDVLLEGSPSKRRANSVAMRDIKRLQQEEEAQQRDEEEKRNNFCCMTYEQYRAEKEQERAPLMAEIRHLSQHNNVLQGKTKRMAEQIAELERQLKATKERLRRRTKASSPAAEAHYFLELDVLQFIDSLIAGNGGGTGRLSFTSDEWHEKHPDAAKAFFGFISWKETKLYIRALFPDVDTNCVGYVVLDEKKRRASVEPVGLTEFEKCLNAKMFMHSMPFRNRLGSIFGVHRTTITNYIEEWLPRWGKAGEQLSILMLTQEYLEKELPDEYRRLGYENIGFLMDGKDFIAQVKRKDGKLQRCMYSDKVHAAAARCITWTTPSGLTFEHTYLSTGRVTENALVDLYGRVGREDGSPAEAPVEQWRNYAKENALPSYLKLDTALSDLDISIIRRAIEKVKKGEANHDSGNDSDFSGNNEDVLVLEEQFSENDGHGSDDDDSSYLSGMTSDAKNDGRSSSDNESLYLHCRTNDADDGKSSGGELDSSVSDSGSSKSGGDDSGGDQDLAESISIGTPRAFNCSDQSDDESVPGGDLCMKAMERWIEMKRMIMSKDDVKRAGKRPLILDTPDEIMELAKKLVDRGPQSNPVDLILQLELHERLHELYESKQLEHCVLSYYLLVMRNDRLALLHWLGSSAPPDDYVPDYGESPPKVMLRLAKIPPKKEGLGDKGFVDTSFSYPYMPRIHTPEILRGRLVKQYDPMELKKKGPLCRLRYSSEVDFSRDTVQDGTRDVIGYQNIALLPHMHEWGHAIMNLMKPLRLPGRESGVDRWTYWGENTSKLGKRKQRRKRRCRTM